MGEWGPSVKEYSLYHFQCRIGAKIPPEDEEGLSMKPTSVRQRKRRAKLKKKADYEQYIRDMRKNVREKNKNDFRNVD